MECSARILEKSDVNYLSFDVKISPVIILFKVFLRDQTSQSSTAFISQLFFLRVLLRAVGARQRFLYGLQENKREINHHRIFDQAFANC